MYKQVPTVNTGGQWSQFLGLSGVGEQDTGSVNSQRL